MADYTINRMIYNMLLQKGVQPNVAIGAVGSLMGESGHKLNPNAINPNDNKKSVIHPDSIGLGQWNDTRAIALKNTAQRMGTTWNDPRAQVAHLGNELSGTHKHVLNALLNGKTIEDGNRVWTTQYEVPANAELRARERLHNGYAFAKVIGNAPGPVQVASLDPSITATPGPTRVSTGLQPIGAGGGLLGFGPNGPQATATAPSAQVPPSAAPYAGVDRQGLLNFDTSSDGLVPPAYRAFQAVGAAGTPAFTKDEAKGMDFNKIDGRDDGGNPMFGGLGNWNIQGGVGQGMPTPDTPAPATSPSVDPLGGTTGINPVGAFAPTLSGLLGSSGDPETEIVGTDPSATTAPAPASPVPQVNTPDVTATGPVAGGQNGQQGGQPGTNTMSAMRQGLEGLTKAAAGLAMKGPLHYAPPAGGGSPLNTPSVQQPGVYQRQDFILPRIVYRGLLG